MDWTLARDRAHRFRFASLQGSTAHDLVPEYAGEAGLSTVVLLDGEGKHVRSDAVVRLLKGLGGVHKAMGILLQLIPRPIRDWGYRRIAQNRYEKWGRRESCRLPTEAERDRFLP